MTMIMIMVTTKTILLITITIMMIIMITINSKDDPEELERKCGRHLYNLDLRKEVQHPSLDRLQKKQYDVKNDYLMKECLKLAVTRFKDWNQKQIG